MNRLWKCVECGKEGFERWTNLVRQRGYHFASDDIPRCTGTFVFIERRRASDPLLARDEELLPEITRADVGTTEGVEGKP